MVVVMFTTIRITSAMRCQFNKSRLLHVGQTFRVLVQLHRGDAIMQGRRVVTEPEAVATGSYTQPAIDKFSGRNTYKDG